MAMATRPVTSTIWVGNLPFDITEAELGQILSTAGTVKNLRLIVDRETGKGKGFGFVEFFDKATAESAFRNLNNTEVHGRNIRIDFAEEKQLPRDRDDRPQGGDRRDGRGGREPRDRAGGERMIGYAAAAESAQQVAAMLGGSAATDRRTQDQLNELLASKKAPELWEVLRLLRDQFGGDRQAAVNWFAERPGIAKAVFQAQVLLGMVKSPPAGPATGPPAYGQPPPANFQEGPIGLGGRMGGPGGPGGPPPAGVPGGPRPMAPSVGGPMGLPPVGVPPPGPGMPMQQVVMVDPATGQQQFVQMPPQQQIGGPGMPLQQPQGMMQMPPQQQQMHMTPQHQLQMQPMGQEQLVMQPIQAGPPQQPMMMQQPQQPPSGGAAGVLGGQDPAHMQALLRQVMTMTDEQINSLPEQFKQQVLFVKEQIRLGAVKVE